MQTKKNKHIQEERLANNRTSTSYENCHIPLSEQVLLIKKIAAWMNERDFFWLMDIRTEFNIGPNDTKTNKLPGMFGKLIGELKRKNIINCTEVKKGQKQFMRTTLIDVDAIGLGSRLMKNLEEKNEE